MRQILLDTETTGLNPKMGDRIIEIGMVELIKRKLTHHNYHQYIFPEHRVPQDAIDIHGITDNFLKDKPLFGEIVEDFMTYISGVELIIHNAPFDIAFINHELSLLPNNRWGIIEDHCVITDSLKMARKAYPGQKNSLDALCKRLGIDNTNRTLHGALLDSKILADVYLTMTGGQTALSLNNMAVDTHSSKTQNGILQPHKCMSLKVIRATDAELGQHIEKLAEISKSSGDVLSW